jgi:molybdenum cofactor cytidylyltransferase
LLISAILLAAGESRRMGELKQLLPFREKTVIEQGIDNLLNSQVDKIVVVLGHEWKRILEKIHHLPVTIVVNENYRQGMLSSIQRGLQVLSGSNQAILVMLGDQPHIPSSVIDQLIEAYGQGTHGIIIPKYEGKRGHPVLLDGKYREEILKTDPANPFGLNQIVRSHPEDILEISVTAPAIIQDIDTPEDYSRIKDEK